MFNRAISFLFVLVFATNAHAGLVCEYLRKEVPKPASGVIDPGITALNAFNAARHALPWCFDIQRGLTAQEGDSYPCFPWANYSNFPVATATTFFQIDNKAEAIAYLDTDNVIRWEVITNGYTLMTGGALSADAVRQIELQLEAIDGSHGATVDAAAWDLFASQGAVYFQRCYDENANSSPAPAALKVKATKASAAKLAKAKAQAKARKK